MRRKVIVGVVLAAAAAWSIWRQDWPRYQRLASRGAATEGWVTAKGLGGSRVVNYSFMVGRDLHSGIASAGPDYDALGVDDDVVVYYLPEDPDVSSLGDPKDRLRAQNRLLLLGLAAAVPVLWLAFGRELRSQ